MVSMNYIKSPLNYTGGKFKLLPQIIPLFPKDIDNFIDLFGGGANVCINVEAKKIYYNDSLTQVVDLLRYLYIHDTSRIISQLDVVVNKYQLSKENEKGYYDLRNDYNKSITKSSIEFYALICHSFNNQIRFNKKGEFNLPFGRRSSLNPKLKQKFIDFINHIKTLNVKFINLDFRKFKVDGLNKNSFLYLDPPYLISCATYNEQDGWNEKDEIDLLNLLDRVDSIGSKFALSNVLENKGQENKILKEWSKKYNIHHIKNNFKNSNHQRVKDDITKEVLITNY